MSVIKILLLLLAIFSPLATPNSLALGKQEVYAETTENVRVVAAKEKLSRDSNTVVLYAKGLCCPSCAIGIRKMISKLDFVDRKRLNKGVELDPKTQLVTIAVKESEEANFKLLSKAIERAGYAPVRSYTLLDNELKTQSLEHKKTQSTQ